MRRILFPCIATAALALASLEVAAPASAADLYVSPQPRARVQYDYDIAPRYRYQRVDVYEEPAPVYYEERVVDDYAPPPVAYGRPIPPAPIVAEYGYAPRGYYRNAPVRTIDMLDDDD
jgi:hypothetical protein